MKKLLIVLCLLLVPVLTGCSVFDGSYVSVTPHELSPDTPGNPVVSVSEFSELYEAMEDMIHDGSTSGVIVVSGYPQSQVEPDAHRAIAQICLNDPVAAYGVGEITFELGKSGGQPAIALTVDYTHDRTELRKLKKVDTMEQGLKIITAALDQCQGRVVYRVKKYTPVDLEQAVYDYATENPNLIMEQPQVTVNLYPQTGEDRVVELKFRYQTGRDSLRTLQSQVQPVFTSAALYVSGDASALQKYSQLYSFLMERFDYQLSTSITPAYSLLCHGVGDSRAFATVYSAMCRQAGLSCQTVTGTCQGESRWWNLICVEGVYYHVDLLADSFLLRTDAEMTGYVWDYSAYPESGAE